MDPTVVCDAGPDTGAAIVVGAASVVVGRSPTADLTIRDRAAELHHLLVESDGPGAVRVTQLSGRVIARIGDRPLAPAAVVPFGGVVSFGASRLRVGVAGRSLRPASTVDLADVLDPSSPAPMRTDDDGTMFRVHVGVADRGGPVVADCGSPVVADLEPGSVVQLTGAGAAGVARSFVVQLAAQVPAERVALTVSGATGWLPDGVRLPHLKHPAAGEHHIVFAADPGAGSLDLAALRARLTVSADAAVVVLDDRDVGPNPNLPGGRLCLGALGRGRWAPNAELTGALHLHAAAVTTDTVVRFAARFDAPVEVPPVDGPPVGTPPTERRGAGTGDPGPGFLVPVERLAAGRTVETIDVVGAWRRADGPPTLWLGREGAAGLWLQLGGPVVVLGHDPARRLDVLRTYAAALALEHGPSSLGLVLGEGLEVPAPSHLVGTPLPPRRIGHELARPHPNGGRATVIAADDDGGEAATAALAMGIAETVAEAASVGRFLVLGVAPEHPWVGPLLTDPAATVAVAGLDDLDAARRLADSRAIRLGLDQVMIRTPGRPFHVATLPSLGHEARRSLAATLAHAEALTATTGAVAVRTCEPCPDDDSPWARPSSDPSSETMLVPASSPG